MNPYLNRDVNLLYAKDKQFKYDDVQILQAWLKKQAHLPELTDFEVTLFLHSCYYRIEAAKKTIDIYFTRRTLYSDIFESLNEEDLRHAFSVGLIIGLPKRTPEDDIILFARLNDARVESFDFTKLFKMLQMVCVLGTYKQAPMNGAVVVFDYKGFGFAHLTKVNFMVLKHGLAHLQEGAPVRIKGIHFINALSMMDKLMALAKPFLSSELYNMIQFHSSLDTFYKFVPHEYLPEDYGGSAPTCKILQEETLQILLNNSDFFVHHDGMKVDESRRVEKSDSFGIEGTFKRLEID